MKKDTKDIVECTQKTSSETNSNSFMKVFNNSKDALLIISGNDFIECNKSAVRLLNAKSKNDVLATHPSQLSPKKQPDGMESYKKANEMMSIAYQKGFHRFEWVHEKLTGEVFPVEVSLTAIEYDNKLVLYTLWKDLTEKKKREKQLIVSSNKLKHSEARFRELFNNMDSGVAIYEAIDNGNNFVMKKINDSGCALSNVTRKNVLGKCITESFPAVNEFGLLKILQEVHRTGQSCRLPATFYKDEKLARWFENFVYKLPSGEIIAIYDDKTFDKQSEITVIDSRNKLEKLTSKLHVNLLGAVSALANTVEYRDRYTAGHSRNVSDLACAIAVHMGLLVENVEALKMAGLLHDIGKIATPLEILVKPLPLTKEEWIFIKAHSQIGHDLVAPIQFPLPVAQFILEHHERLDGSGYPFGKTDKELLIESKILAVADVVEAMSLDRPYREALGLESALDNITKHKGILFDNEVVDACVWLFKKEGFKFRPPN